MDLSVYAAFVSPCVCDQIKLDDYQLVTCKLASLSAMTFGSTDSGSLLARWTMYDGSLSASDDCTCPLSTAAAVQDIGVIRCGRLMWKSKALTPDVLVLFSHVSVGACC